MNAVYSKMSLTLRMLTHITCTYLIQLLSKSLSLTPNSLDSWFRVYSCLYWVLSGLKAGLICVGMACSKLSIEPVTHLWKRFDYIIKQCRATMLLFSNFSHFLLMHKITWNSALALPINRVQNKVLHILMIFFPL